MSWLETLRSSLDAVIANRMRFALTVLGILIGIAAVILTVGLGEGSQATVNNAISSLGTNLLIVTPGSTTSGGVRGGLGSSSVLTRADAAALDSRIDCPDIAAVAPVVQRNAGMVAGAANWNAPVAGTTPAYLGIRGRTIAQGRFLSSDDVTGDAHVVVLGPGVVAQLFPDGDALGQTVDINQAPFQVVGVLGSPGSSASANEDNLAVVPVSVAQDVLFGGGNPTAVNQILIEATSQQTIGAAYQEAESQLLNLTGAASPGQAQFTITPQTAILSTAQTVSRTLTILLGGIAAISLLVGGIGVMNIMLVSVTERIREIGLRKAVGATPAAIRQQFLAEALILGITGGMLGVGVAVLAAAGLTHLIANPVILSAPVAVVAVLVAAGIGLIFGVYPASRAARLTPIDALRSE